MNCQFFVLAPGWVEWYVAGCTSTKVALQQNEKKYIYHHLRKMKICSYVGIKRQQLWTRKGSNLDSHLSHSSAVRQEMYLLPWVVFTWKQWSWLRTLGCTAFTSASRLVKSTACIAHGFDSRDSWERDVRIRELIKDLRIQNKTC